MRIGFTGSRHGMTVSQAARLRRLLIEHQPNEFHHGQCIGADVEAHAIALELQLPRIIVHPPTDPTLLATPLLTSESTMIEYLPPAHPLKRNKAIVRAIDLLIAAPATAEEEIRSGTWHTVRFARRHGRVRVVVLPPRQPESQESQPRA